MNIKKSNNIFLAALFLTATLNAPLQVLADTSQSVETSITNASDTIINDTWGTAPVSFNTADGTLTIYSGTIGVASDPIGTKIKKAGVKKIIFKDGVKAPADSSFLFCASGGPSNDKFTNLTNIEGPLDTSHVTNMSYMFYESAVTSLDLSSFDTSKVTVMTGMFFNSRATSLDLSTFDTANVTDMSYMFYYSAATSLDLSSFDTSKVISMNLMFYESAATSLDLSSFDTANVTDMRSMFESSKATSLDLSSFDTSKVISMNLMFYESAATSLDLSSFDTANVTDMRSMFESSKATSLDLSSFDTANVTDMSYMFYKATVNTLKLGTKSKFNSTVNLTENITSPYTGKWLKISPQLPVSVYESSSDFMTNYDGFNPGTYVRQKTQEPTSNPNNPGASNTNNADQNNVKVDNDDGKSAVNTVTNHSIPKKNNPAGKQLIEALLPDTAAEKIGISAILAIVLSGVTGIIVFKSRRNKQ